MARAPDRRIEQAKVMYLKGQKLAEIARELDLPEGTVRRWKCTHKWDNERSDKKANVRKRGAQPGNKNSAGNRGGAAPPGNKNAVTTGEFESLLFDCLDEDDKRLAQAVPQDKVDLLMQEIRLATIRERKMLHRIEAIRETVEHLEDGTQVDGMTVVKFQSGIEKGKVTDLREYQGKLGQIQSIEEAITRVQARKQKMIETLHRFSFDDAKLELEIMKIELASVKFGDGETELVDDGFMEALNAEAGCLWEDNDE